MQYITAAEMAAVVQRTRELLENLRDGIQSEIIPKDVLVRSTQQIIDTLKDAERKLDDGDSTS